MAIKHQPEIDRENLPTDSPKMRAKRVKRVRNMANLSRDEMCKDGEINLYTLIGWENGRFGGLTTSGAEKIVAKVKKEGVHCTVEWLMENQGPAPSVNPITFDDTAATDLSDEVVIDYELAFFKAKNVNAVSLTVDDEGMLPQFREGDVVAGKKRTGQDIDVTIGHDCIVETENGEVLLRNVREGKFRHTYTLVCNNPTLKKKPSIVTDIKLIYSAPVIWHRKKDIL
ncbi:MAG TPA: hypothetical protein VHE99_10365 [Gammaproteobacteria bacterium]|nr:hypothetical protein [Gammaproteobacteria bacterium]